MSQETTQSIRFNRRQLFASLGAASVGFPVASLGQSFLGLDITGLGVTANSTRDQSGQFQAAINLAASQGRPLFVPSGSYFAHNLSLPSGLDISGVAGETLIRSKGGFSVFGAEGQKNITIEGIDIEGDRHDSADVDLLTFYGCSNISFKNLGVRNGASNGIRVETCQGQIDDCRFTSFGESAVHAQNSVGFSITHNRIKDCANGGIRVWRYEIGTDRTNVTDNHISDIRSQSGNGQNGNGINIFRADEVVISNNVINECDFSAIRLNGTNNSLVHGNICSRLKEVAIFSEFSFSGSIIANNVIDQAAQGISITNFDHGGRLAVCSDNIIRNIWSSSPTNPDTFPVGIGAEAEVAISGNVIETVPGIGILAGWGPYLRNVLVSNNIVRSTEIGIAVSVAEGAGNAHIANNLIANARRAGIKGMAWYDEVGTDLTKDPHQFAHVHAVSNTLSNTPSAT